MSRLEKLIMCRAIAERFVFENQIGSFDTKAVNKYFLSFSVGECEDYLRSGIEIPEEDSRKITHILINLLRGTLK